MVTQQENKRPGIVQMLSESMNVPIVHSKRFAPKVNPTTFAMSKAQPYSAVAGARPSIDISRMASITDIPSHKQYATQAMKQRADIIANLQRQMTMPNTSKWSVPRGSSAVAQLKGGAVPGGSFGAFVAAIKGKESGGNYSAVNRHSGATGAYQIMPANIGPWSREILGRTVSRAEFLRNPKIQDAIAIGKLRQYYNKYGPGGAAVAWYAGPGAVAKKMNSTRAQGQYPSINAYMNSILKMMGR